MRREGPRTIASVLFVMALIALFLAYDLHVSDETAYAVVALVAFLVLLVAGMGAVSWGRRRARLAGHLYTPPFMEDDGRRVDELYPVSSLHERRPSSPHTHTRTYVGTTQEDLQRMFGAADPWDVQPYHRIYDEPISAGERRMIEDQIRSFGMDPDQFDTDGLWAAVDERVEVATLGEDYTEEEHHRYRLEMDAYHKELGDYHAGRRATRPQMPPLPGRRRRHG